MNGLISILNYNLDLFINTSLSTPVDVSKLLKQSYDLAATEKYYNQHCIIKPSGNIEQKSIDIENQKMSRLGFTAISNKIYKDSREEEMEEEKEKEKEEYANINYLRKECGWTSKQEKYIYSGYLEAAEQNGDCPELVIIEPNSVDNIQILAYMNSRNRGKKSKKKVGIFTEFLFFSHKATDSLCGKLGLNKTNCDTQNIYQFEARYFQYSVLSKRIRFCKDYRNGKEYMIFKFGRVSKIVNDDLYAICEKNNRSQQQPWMCQHIFTLNEMLIFFDLNSKTATIQQGFLDAMRIHSNCVSKIFDTNCECKSQSNKIARMLDNGYQQYLNDLSVKNGGPININNNNNMDYLSPENNSQWCNDDLVPTRSNSSNYSTGSLSGISVLSSGNRSISVDSDINSVSSSSLSSRPSSARSGRSVRSSSLSSSSKQGLGKKEHKIKNEDKFSFLETICRELGLGLGVGFTQEYGYSYNQLPRELLKLLGESIENAIKFARKYPDTVLTQAYIDEDHGSISYELVLIAEIANKLNGKYYKFAVPIVECKNSNNGSKYYKAENILTPKMVMDNVRLNSENAQFKKGTWIADMSDVRNYKSFYQQIDKTWYDELSNNNNNSESKSLSLLMTPSVASRSVSIEMDYKRQTLSRRSTSDKMFGFGDDEDDIHSISTSDSCSSSSSSNSSSGGSSSNYSTQRFYEIGFNINNGGSKRSNRSNKGNRGNRGNRGRNNMRNHDRYHTNNNNNNNEQQNRKHDNYGNMDNRYNNYNNYDSYDNYNNNNNYYNNYYDSNDCFNNNENNYNNMNNNYYRRQYNSDMYLNYQIC